MKIHCSCNKEFTLVDPRDRSSWMEFLNHFCCEWFAFECKCGETHTTGPDVNGNPVAAAKLAGPWLIKHHESCR